MHRSSSLSTVRRVAHRTTPLVGLLRFTRISGGSGRGHAALSRAGIGCNVLGGNYLEMVTAVCWLRGSSRGSDILLAVMTEQLPEPFATGLLDVGDGHVLYYEQVGVPEGAPILYLHGGPGTGCTPRARRYFDLQRHRAVLFDQRAAGRSTPHASDDGVHWESIDMDHHLCDIELLRDHLGIERWVVFGISWGSVLGATYAEHHPERVVAVVLAAVSTGTAADIDWLTVHAGRFFPAEWHEFRDHIPTELRDMRLVDAYNTLLMDTDPAVAEAAAVAWCRWEDAHVATTRGAGPNPRYQDPTFRLGFARQVTHCWRHNSWLAPDEIVRNANRLAGIPGWLIHGRLDLSGPLDAPWRIHQAWPGSELIIVDEEGHGGDVMDTHWRRILANLT